MIHYLLNYIAEKESVNRRFTTNIHIPINLHSLAVFAALVAALVRISALGYFVRRILLVIIERNRFASRLFLAGLNGS